jgi:hypothetical protein
MTCRVSRNVICSVSNSTYAERALQAIRKLISVIENHFLQLTLQILA